MVIKFKLAYNIFESEKNLILNPKEEHKYTMIFLHGLGDSPYGFLDVFLENITPVNNVILNILSLIFKRSNIKF